MTDETEAVQNPQPKVANRTMVRVRKTGLWVGVDIQGARLKSKDFEGPYIVEVTTHPPRPGRRRGDVTFRPIARANAAPTAAGPVVPPIVLPGEEELAAVTAAAEERVQPPPVAQAQVAPADPPPQPPPAVQAHIAGETIIASKAIPDDAPNPDTDLNSLLDAVDVQNPN